MRGSVGGFEINIEHTEGLFSPKAFDRGTLAMLSVCEFERGMKVLDLGCGYGLVGIYAAHICGEENVIMSDVDINAVTAAKENAAANGFTIKTVHSSGFSEIDDTGFDMILSNPPYQSDFAVAKHFIEKGFNRLKLGGKMVLVTKRRAWYENKLRGIFGGVRVYEIDGYFVFISEKRSSARNNSINAKAKRELF